MGATLNPNFDTTNPFTGPSSNMSTPYGQRTSSPGVHPGLHGQGVQGQDMLALIQAILQAQQQTGMQRGAQQREGLTDVHRSTGGGIIDPTTGKDPSNPFDNGFFGPNALKPVAPTPVMPQTQPMGAGPSSVTPTNGMNFLDSPYGKGYAGVPQGPTMPPKPMAKRPGSSFNFTGPRRAGM